MQNPLFIEALAQIHRQELRADADRRRRTNRTHRTGRRFLRRS